MRNQIIENVTLIQQKSRRVQYTYRESLNLLNKLKDQEFVVKIDKSVN